jgi:protease-4
LRLERRQYLLHVIECLDRAARDQHLGAIWITIDRLEAGWSVIQTLRDAILDVRRAGKQVIVFLEEAGNGTIFLASAADRIVLAPSGSLHLTGLRAEVLFLRGTLDRARVEAEIVRLGEYKSAAEPLTRTSLSPEAREALESILDDLYDQFVAGIAEGRGLPPERVRDLVDAGPYRAPAAKEARLVDEVCYEDEVEARLPEFLGRPGGRPFVLPADRWLRIARRMPPPPGTRIPAPRMAFLLAEGFVRSGRTRAFPPSRAIASASFVEALRQARDDPRVQAIVLRVDSPGGSGLASDVVWRELRLAREKKPLVVSMGNVAASGGYYLAMGADWIVAEPATLTGSIGVIAGKLNLRGLYDLLGLSKEVIDRGARAGAQSDYRPFTKAEREKLEQDIRAFYDDFVAKAASCRHLQTEEVDKAARGRVWTGRQALSLRLVDELGGIRAAIAAAKRRAGIPFAQPVRLEVYPRAVPSLLDLLARSPLRGIPRSGSEALALAEAGATLREGELLALWPVAVTIR